MNYALPDSVQQALYGRSVLITGARGFLGRHFMDAVESCGAEPLGLDIVDEDDEAARDFVHRMRKVLPYDFVIHAAGIASPFHYRRDPLGALRAAVDGTENMLRLAELWNARLLFLSSSEIYGDPTVVPTPETYRGALDTMGDRSCYDVSKALGETLVRIYADKGVRATVVRLFNAFGPGMHEDDRRFMPNLRNAKRRGETMRIYGSGQQTRTFCFVSDTIRGCLQALVQGQPGRAYNIGNDKPEVNMPAVCEYAGVKFEVIPNPKDWPNEGEPQRRCPDITRAREELGYEPRVSFEEGLREFLR